MILVDTSVWIRFFANKEPHRSGLDRLLAKGEVLGHEFVIGELLMGDRGGRSKLLAAYSLMQQARCVPHEEVFKLVQTRRFHGRGVGWIDIHLLASAVLERASLWTADPRLAQLASEMHSSYGQI
jgi:predicted nucleic acid-binding protein